MSDNLISPLINSVWEVGRYVYRLITRTNKRFDFDNFFKVCNIKNSKDEYPKLYKEVECDIGKRYLFTIPVGLSLKDFEKHQDALEAQLNFKVNMILKNKLIEITIVKEDLPTMIPYQLQILPPISKGIQIPIGITANNDIVLLNLREHPHSFVVGATSSGKSVCLKATMVSIITNYSPDDIEIYLGDLKYVEFSLLKNANIVKKFVTSVEDVTDMIQELLDETERRYQLFEERGVTDIFSFNRKYPGEKLKFQILLVEEIVNLLQDKKKTAMNLLKRLIAISRSSGLYCIFSTQRPSADVIDAVVRANISNRITFHTESEKDSIICLDEAGAESLDIKGRGIIKIGSKREVFQGYFIEDEEVKKYIKPYLKPKEVANKNKNNNDELNKINKRNKQDESKKSSDTAKATDEIDLSFLDKI